MKVIQVISGDSNYDQRLQKLCNSLVSFGFEVCLVSCKKEDSVSLIPQRFEQKRLNLIFHRGLFHYAEFNIRVLLFLLPSRCDILVANDVETLMPIYLCSVIRRKKRIADMHELFLDMHELLHKPLIKKIWMAIEACFLPRFKKGYTVSSFISNHYQTLYGIDLKIINNLPYRRSRNNSTSNSKYILYQGTIVEGRFFEEMIEACRQTGYELVICGKGGQYKKLEAHVAKNCCEHVKLLGWVQPNELHAITDNAWIGLNLLSPRSKSYYYSSANRFYDYIQAGLPQISSSFPVYEDANRRIETAVLLKTITVDTIVKAIQQLEDAEFYDSLRQNALKAADIYTWDHQEAVLKQIYFGI